jgi:hypothetical protein
LTILGIGYCQDDKRMREVALEFSHASNGVISGCIGVLDGWVVKIRNLQSWTMSMMKNCFTVARGSTD